MSINDLTPDSCNDVHILTDLSRHFAFDSTLREDILPNPLFLDSDLPDSIPIHLTCMLYIPITQQILQISFTLKV